MKERKRERERDCPLWCFHIILQPFEKIFANLKYKHIKAAIFLIWELKEIISIFI